MGLMLKKCTDDRFVTNEHVGQEVFHRITVRTVTADIMMGGMTLINLPIILYLGKYAIRTLKHYEGQLKKGGKIAFRKEDIDLPYETDYWN